MKKQLREAADKAKLLLEKIKLSHRYSLLDEEVINIRSYLQSLLKKNPEAKNLDSCKKFWNVGISKGRALARDLALIKRSEIVDEVGSTLEEIEKLSLDHLMRIVEEINKEIIDCVTELHSSRKKKPKIDPNETEPEFNPFRSKTPEEMTKASRDQKEFAKNGAKDKGKYQSRRHPMPPIPRSR